MAATIITPDDLEAFRVRLLEDIQKLLSEKYQKPIRRWLKGHEVSRLLTVSPSTLHRLRADGTLPFTRIGGVIFYDHKDVEEVLEKHKRHRGSLPKLIYKPTTKP